MEKTAKEMFEELGFHTLISTPVYLVWRKEEYVEGQILYSAKEFEFCIGDKSFMPFEYSCEDKNLLVCTRISHQEFLAITQQMKELGWNY